MPLTRLTNRDIEFEWNASCEVAIKLRNRLTSEPSLTIPNSQDQYIVYINVSENGLGYM